VLCDEYDLQNVVDALAAAEPPWTGAPRPYRRAEHVDSRSIWEWYIASEWKCDGGGGGGDDEGGTGVTKRVVGLVVLGVLGAVAAAVLAGVHRARERRRKAFVLGKPSADSIYAEVGAGGKPAPAAAESSCVQ
jgi:hypothetical protein